MYVVFDIDRTSFIEWTSNIKFCLW